MLKLLKLEHAGDKRTFSFFSAILLATLTASVIDSVSTIISITGLNVSIYLIIMKIEEINLKMLLEIYR